MKECIYSCYTHMQINTLAQPDYYDLLRGNSPLLCQILFVSLLSSPEFSSGLLYPCSGREKRRFVRRLHPSFPYHIQGFCWFVDFLLLLICVAGYSYFAVDLLKSKIVVVVVVVVVVVIFPHFCIGSRSISMSWFH